MFKETLDSIVDGDLELAKDAITREYEADTIYWLLIRLLASAQQSRVVMENIGIKDSMDIVQHSIIAWYLEMIGDRINHMAKKTIELQELQQIDDNNLLDRLSQIGVISFNMFDKAVSSIFNGDLTVASDAVDMYEIIEYEESTLMKRFQYGSSPELTAVVSEIAWDLQIIAEYSSAIAKISIDSVLKNENDYCHFRNDL
jgi:phosphate uptake regulator